MAETPGTELTAEISNYMRTRIHHLLNDSVDDSPIPRGWTLEFIEEVHQFLDVILQAVRNRKMVPWAADDYMEYLQEYGPRASGTNAQFEKRACAQFPRLFPGKAVLEVEPFVLCDLVGKIIFWYLPGALKPERQFAMWQGLDTMEDSLVVNERATSWRANDKYYMKPEHCPTHPAGTFGVSPAWYQQGHSKSDPLEVSAELRKECGLAWITEMHNTSALMGAALSILHPTLFNAGLRVLGHISEHPEIVEKAENLPQILDRWSSPYTALSVINNRCETPVHRDSGGAYSSVDLLATVGPYSCGYMSLPSIGIDVSYSPGTVVGILARILPHGVTSGGERACFAYYMKENVLESVLTHQPGWANISDILAI